MVVVKKSGSGSYKDLPTGHKMDTIDVSNQLCIYIAKFPGD